jgi:hypothetical protein
VAAEIEDTTDVDEAIMTAEEMAMAIAMAGYAQRKPSSSTPPVVARPKFNLRPLVFGEEAEAS